MLRLYERAIRNDPSHIQSHLNYGISLRELGRYDEASSVLHRALQHHPDSLSLQMEMAHIHTILGEINAAASYYERILISDPNSTSALLNIAALYHKVLRVDEALSGYSRAIASISSYDQTCFNNLFSNDPRDAWAISPFSSNNQNNPCKCPTESDSTFVRKILSNTGQALHQLGRFEEAIKSFSESLQLQRACDSNWKSSSEYLTASILQFLAAKAGCYFDAWDWLKPMVNTISHLLDSGAEVSANAT